MTDSNPTIVIVGGVAGGASAATRARRMNENAEIILFEKDDHVSFANCGMPYHIGDEIPDRGKLIVASAELLERRFAIDVRAAQEVTDIDPVSRTVGVHVRRGERTYRQRFDKLILAPGAAPLVPPIPGVDAENVFTLRNLADMDRIRAAADSSVGRRAVVVGAGFIGLEMVEQLVRRGFDVALAELQHQVLPTMDAEMVEPIHRELERNGVSMHLGDGIAAVETDEAGRVTGVRLSSGTIVEGDVVILGLGVRPNTRLAAEAGLAIGAGGGIIVDRCLRTSVPDIYAVGDAVEYEYGPTRSPLRVALAGPANRAGRLAGEHAATGQCAPMGDVFGTAIVRVFDKTIASTGLSLNTAKRMGVDVESVTIVAGNHAGYFPGATPLTLKLVFDPKNDRLLGAQVVGEEGVDKRIDVIATAMSFDATVRDLADLDLAYAPPFGSAKDPIHHAAFAASNHLDGVDVCIEADADLGDWQVVDVRSPAEIERSPLNGTTAVNIPVDELRDRFGELDPSRPTVVSCAVGRRAHVATRILAQKGFGTVRNLSGGATVRNRAVPE